MSFLGEGVLTEQPAPRQPVANCPILSMRAHRGVIWG